MLGYLHTTQEGKTMLVGQMDTNHLLNLIRMRLRKCNEIYVASKQVGSAYKTRLYGLQSVSPELAAEQINRELAALSPYVLEAFFRCQEIGSMEQMRDIWELMQSFMERDGQLPADLPLLNRPSYELIKLVDDEDKFYPDDDDDVPF